MNMLWIDWEAAHLVMFIFKSIRFSCGSVVCLLPAQQGGPGFDSSLDLDWVSSCPVTTGMGTMAGLEGET